MMTSDNQEEIYDIFDEDGFMTGRTASRREVHEVGLWHRTVHVWIVDDDRNILLQRRSPSKESNPGLWDVSIAGHIDSGEGSYQAAVREAREEANLNVQIADLEYLFTVRNVMIEDEYQDREIQDVYLVRVHDMHAEQIKFPEQEVMEFRFFSQEEFWTMVESHDRELVRHNDEYSLLRRYFDSRFS